MDDYDDIILNIRIGNSVRRALIRRFTAELHDILKAQGRDPANCPDVIETYAWRLTDRFAIRLEEWLTDMFDDEAPVFGAGRTANDTAQSFVENTFDEFVSESFTDDPLEMFAFMRAADKAPEPRLVGVPFLRLVKE